MQSWPALEQLPQFHAVERVAQAFVQSTLAELV